MHGPVPEARWLNKPTQYLFYSGFSAKVAPSSGGMSHRLTLVTHGFAIATSSQGVP